MKVRVVTAVLFLTAAFMFASCSTPKLDQAFSRKMDTEESNEVIGQYCLSCHVHKDFNVSDHVLIVGKTYNDTKYESTTECRACHTYRRTWWFDERRGTHRPGEM